MRRIAFALPGRLDAPTGGTTYDRMVIDGLRRRGIEVDVVLLPDSFPFPEPADVAETLQKLAAVPRDVPLFVDGLVFGALPAQGLWALGRDLIVVLHHPLALETGLSQAAQDALMASEGEALSAATQVIVTSATTRDIVVEMFGLDRADIAVALPGTERRSPAPERSGTARLLAVGTLSPRKAQHVLVEALASTADLDWTLTLSGADDRVPDYAAELRKQIEQADLSGRITLTGAVEAERLVDHYATADLFVHTAVYEGYGMAVAEALAHGLPVVATRAGAVPEVVGSAAHLLAAGDASALADALRVLIADPERRRVLRARSIARAAELPRWDDAVAVFEAVLARVGDGG